MSSEQTKKNLIRNVVVVFVGLIVGLIVIMAVQALGHKVFPPTIDITKVKDLESAMAEIPVGSFLFVILSHVLGTFAGCIVGYKFSKGSRFPGLIVGLCFLLATVINVLTLPHPMWVTIIDLALVIVAIFVAMNMIKKD